MTLLLFALVRVVASPLCLASLWKHRALWAPRTGLFYFEFGVTVFFVALNFLWFYKLLRMAARPTRKHDAKRAAPAAASRKAQ